MECRIADFQCVIAILFFCIIIINIAIGFIMIMEYFESIKESVYENLYLR